MKNYILWSILIILVITVITVIIIKCFANTGNFKEILEEIPRVIHKVFIQNSGEMDKFPLEPKELQEAHDSWKQMNPEYEIKYYSLNDCREYLKNNFEDSDFLQAFDCLNAYAFKCDFFRYCVLYNEGGWYSDWKQVCLKKNLLNELNSSKISNIILTWDKGGDLQKKNNFIQNCFIGTTKNNLFLKECINEIINNIKYKYYGTCSLDPTSPSLLGRMYKKYYNNNNNNSVQNKFIPMKNSYFIHNKELGYIINHKCNNCNQTQDWINGNNYNKIWNEKNMYKNFTLKNNIPKIIHKTGPNKINNLSNEIVKIFNDITYNNPDYKIKYYDNDDCFNLIKNNFSSDVLWAYEKLIPTAYKADLFRYCVLYLYGGIYSDLTQQILLPLNDIIDYNKDTLILTEDRFIPEVNFKAIQISFICSIPKNNIFKKAIEQVVVNCKTNYYGYTPLCTTGPVLFRLILNNNNINYNLKLEHYRYGEYLMYKNKKFIKTKSKNHHKILYKNRTHYSTLWENKKIYKLDIKYLNNRSLSEICDIKPNNIVSDSNKLNNIDYNNIKSNDKVFVVGTTFKKFKKILDNINVKDLVLILSASDIGFPVEQGNYDNINYLEYINNSNKIKYIFTSNYDLNNESNKLFPLPLGMDYHTLNEKSTSWGHKKTPYYQEQDLFDIYNNSIKFEHRKNKIYSFFHLNVNPKEGREHTKDRLNAKHYLNFNPLNIYQKNQMNRNDTWKEMVKYKWIASPHGNGLDCHRTYEAIALGCIPIVKTSTLDYLYSDMPVIICKDWNELTNDFLNNKTKETLTKSKDSIMLNYWINKIKMN